MLSIGQHTTSGDTSGRCATEGTPWVFPTPPDFGWRILLPQAVMIRNSRFQLKHFEKGIDESHGKTSKQPSTRLTQVRTDLGAFAIESAMQDKTCKQLHHIQSSLRSLVKLHTLLNQRCDLPHLRIITIGTTAILQA